MSQSLGLKKSLKLMLVKRAYGRQGHEVQDRTPIPCFTVYPFLTFQFCMNILPTQK